MGEKKTTEETKRVLGPRQRSFFSYAPMDHAVAGIGAGAATTLALHPLDLIKIRLQVQRPDLRYFPRGSSLYQAIQHTIKYEGIRGLYQGMSVNIMGGATAWGSYFFMYASLKKQWSRMKDSGGSLSLTAPKKNNLDETQDQSQGEREASSLGAIEHMACASIAGVGTLVVTNPFWVAKTRLCLQTTETSARAAANVPEGAAFSMAVAQQPRYSGGLHALVSIARTEGFKGLYRGFVPGLFGVSHGAFQFMAYEELKVLFFQHKGEKVMAERHGKLDTHEYLIMASSSKIFASTVTYPYQVVRSQLQQVQGEVSISARDAVMRVFKQDGLAGFYKGLVPNTLKVLPATCITFVSYEQLRHLLSELADERHRLQTAELLDN